MKIAGLLCLVFALYQAVVGKAIQAHKITLSVKQERCVNELHLNKNEIKRIHSWDIVPEDNQNYNKFLLCFWTKMDWVNDDGTIKYNNVQEDLILDVIKEVHSNDSHVKLMAHLVVHTKILQCKNNISDITISRFLNCLTREMETLWAAK